MKLVIKELSKIYNSGHKALDNLSLEVNPGMFGLLGPNGAGKTTLMRILALLQAPTSGSVFFDDYDLSENRGFIRSITGYLPQDFRFFDKLKTWEYLDYAAQLSGMKRKKQRRQKVDEMLNTVGLLDVRDRWANRLSGGMKRRLGIAQAIIGEPKILIVDEPTTGLDPEERIRFRNILSEVSSNDVIIILSTHIVGDISSTCQDLALLNKGCLKFGGSPDDMIKLAEGKVWEAHIPDSELSHIKNKYPIISTIPASGGWEVQLVADDKYSDTWTPAKPNIEHAYVYMMDYVLQDRMNMASDGEVYNLFS